VLEVSPPFLNTSLGAASQHGAAVFGKGWVAAASMCIT